MGGIGRNAVRPVTDAVTIQWANGKNEARRPAGAGRFASHVGFFAEVGRDEAFDAFAASHGLGQLEMRHPRQNAAAQIVRHWDLGERARFYPLTRGPVAPTVAASVSPRFIAETIAAGIGVRWGRGAGERSRLAVRGFVQVAVGDAWALYPGMAQLSVRSRMTDKLLAALVDHVRVCEIADTLVDRVKHPDVIACYELALPLGAGAEEEWGKGETATVAPLVSLHPQEVDLPYLRAIWRPDEVAARAEAAWEDVVAWAAAFYGAGLTDPVDGVGGDNGDHGAEGTP